MISNPLLRTYWIEAPRTYRGGFGVTAFSREDALHLLRALGHAQLVDDPELRVSENIRVADLDAQHIVPNMGPIVLRGVWYPLANLWAATAKPDAA